MCFSPGKRQLFHKPQIGGFPTRLAPFFMKLVSDLMSFRLGETFPTSRKLDKKDGLRKIENLPMHLVNLAISFPPGWGLEILAIECNSYAWCLSLISQSLHVGQSSNSGDLSDRKPTSSSQHCGLHRFFLMKSTRALWSYYFWRVHIHKKKCKTHYLHASCFRLHNTIIQDRI